MEQNELSTLLKSFSVTRNREIQFVIQEKAFQFGSKFYMLPTPEVLVLYDTHVLFKFLPWLQLTGNLPFIHFILPYTLSNKSPNKWAIADFSKTNGLFSFSFNEE